MEIIDMIIDEDKRDYKCYDILKALLETNETFKNTIIKGVNEGKITKFSEELWDEIRRQNIRGIDNFESVFRDGTNLGYCTVASKQLSYSFDTCFICGGVLPILKNTPNCIDGSHTWTIFNRKIIDTSLMLIIDEDFAKEIGYQEENRYDPNIDPRYRAAKKMTCDRNLKNGNRNR